MSPDVNLYNFTYATLYFINGVEKMAHELFRLYVLRCSSVIIILPKLRTH